MAQDKHEVFLSFRGEDTRYNFTSHLHAALCRFQIKVFIDNNLVRGDEISTSLIRAIEESKLSVVVLSENYANSKWCLDELVKIVECGQVIVPIFYGIDPSNVRHQSGSYAAAFARHEQQFRGNMSKVQRWRSALSHVANLAGWPCSVNSMQSELVETIAKDVLQKLNYVYVGDLDEQINKMESELMDKIAKDVLQKLDRVYVGDLEHQIAKLEQLAQLQYQFFESTLSLQDLAKHRATNQRITELKMEKSVRQLRLSPDMLSYVGNSSNNNNGYPF